MPTHIIAVGGLVVNDEGQVLVGISRGRGGWEYFGGQVENGENLEEALLREIYEESGVVAQVEALVGVYSNVAVHANEPQYVAMGYEAIIPTKLMLDFRCRYVSGTPRDSDETEGVQWMNVEQAKALITQEPMRTRFLNLLEPPGTIYYQTYKTRPYEKVMERTF